jgi:hypothetical protein
MSARFVGVLAIGVLAFAACGPEDIELASSRDAERDASPGEAGDFGNDASALDCDARTVSPTCEPLGATCKSDDDCCSVHCAGAVCALPGTCAAAGTACTSRAQCCSGLCEPVAGSTTLFCLPECRPVNQPCTRASDCCALGCNGGVCAGAECLREGSDCSANAECCSNECALEDGGGGGGRGKCVIDPVATCRASGDDCHSGGSGTCCGSSVCDGNGRCDPGAGPCRPLGSICASPNDCCPGATCTDDGTGRTLCTSPAPLADGASCVASFECATGSCTANPPVCGPAPASCAVVGASCTTSSQCCSGSCPMGSCEPSPCSAPH